MGGRYGGNIGKRQGTAAGNRRPFFPTKALARLGRDTRRPFEAIGKGTRRLIPKPDRAGPEAFPE